SALGKALVEMKELGLISRLPKLSVIQAEGANPFMRSIREDGGAKLTPMQADTLATAIRIGNPASWKKAERVLKATGGEVEQVSEIEIALAKAEIGADGVGCEPASAVTLAGLKKLVKRGFVKSNENVVLILTGHVLKDPEFTLKFHRGDLFIGTPDEKHAAMLGAQQRAPLVLDATVDAVSGVLDKFDREVPGE
ncbi:MAG TPA: pyridoxal-phosphate dependent enzyme, partial [Bryobacteraceae bacterium]|nr:pyridoxal-phosphate dependent enzyme [Bryobacteraceae bacterium]